VDGAREKGAILGIAPPQIRAFTPPVRDRPASVIHDEVSRPGDDSHGHLDEASAISPKFTFNSLGVTAAIIGRKQLRQ